jgi:hypothetical protein
MAARVPMVASAGIVLALGVIHLTYTILGQKLTPRDPAVRVATSRA